ncbi:unnamed protein product, partial [Dovyalis caffra]
IRGWCSWIKEKMKAARGVDLAEMGDGFVKEETHLGLNLGKENTRCDLGCK